MISVVEPPLGRIRSDSDAGSVWISPQHRRVLLASLIGSAIEWFDYFLYGTVAALVFARLYFPQTDPHAALMLTYASFALPFLVRPFGGVVLAHLGDVLGRKRTLILTLTLMGGGTALIGVLPTYQQIGVAAPVGLVLLRLLQGIGIGGEWGGAVLLAVEHAPPHRRALYGSIPQAGVTLGLLLSTLAVSLISLLPEPAFLSWGWRLPFIGSLTLLAVGLWIRRGVAESPEFLAAQSAAVGPRAPLWNTLRWHWPQVLCAAGAKMVETGPYYLFTVFVIGYATRELGYSRFAALNAVTAGALLSLVTIPLCGWLADRVGRRTVFLTGCLLMALAAVPYFALLDLKRLAALMMASLLALGVVWPPVTATLSSLMAQLFPTRVRYTGVTLGYQLGAAAIGGTAPLIASLLLVRDHGSWSGVALYIVLTAVGSAIAIAGWRVRGGAQMSGPADVASSDR